MKVITTSLILIVCIFGLAYFEHEHFTSFNINSLKEYQIQKTKPLENFLEREYKLSVVEPQGGREQFLNSIILDALTDVVDNSKKLETNKILQKSYHLEYPDASFVFRDIYFDTKNNTLSKKNLGSYRLRYRWKDMSSFVRYSKGERSTLILPVRKEIQYKKNEEIIDKLFISQEVRQKLNTNSEKIKLPTKLQKNISDTKEHILMMKTGKNISQLSSPSVYLSKIISNKLPQQKSLFLKSKLIILTKRIRYHLNMKSPRGLGENPDNAILISIDRFTPIFLERDISDEYSISQAIMNNIFSGNKLQYTEVEVELERNKTHDEKLLQKAFLSDLDYVRKKIYNKIRNNGLKVEYSSKSKSDRFLTNN